MTRQCIIREEAALHFIAGQRDFLMFVSLFSFIISALECVVLNREERGRRWLSVFSFFLWQGLAVLWVLVSPVVPAGPRSALLAPFLQSLSFGSLLAFASSLTASLERKRRMVGLSLVTVAACGVIGIFLGEAPYSLFSGLLLGLPGFVFAVRFLLSDPAIRSQGRPWLVIHAFTLAMFGLLFILEPAGALLFHGRLTDAALVLRVFVSLALAVTLSMHEWRSFARLNRGYGRRRTRVVIFGSFLALPLLLVLGGLATSALGRLAGDTLRAEYRNQADVIEGAIAAQTDEIDRDVSLLAGGVRTGAFLAQRDALSHTQAVEALDLFARTIQGDCYLLDITGNTVASSSGAPEPFIGISHGEAPWFKEAVGGGAGRVFDVDRPTHVRGYYASAPVWGPTQGIIGVAVIVKNISSLFPPVSASQHAFLINEYGVIFFSTRSDLTYRVLWPLSPATRNAMTATRQFSYASFAPVLDAKPSDGKLVSWSGPTYMASRPFLSIPGWSVVHLGSIDEIILFRLAGLFATLVVTLVIAMFSAVGQMSLLDEARTERSESLYRTLIEGSPSWVSIVDTSGAFTFTNRAGREDLGLLQHGRVEDLLGAEHVARMAGGVQVALHGSTVSFETTLPSATGEVKVWRITLVPLRAAGQEPAAILIGYDVTEMRRAEASLVRAERMAALGTLTAGVAHQFNNINAVAMGYIQVLEADPDLPEKAKAYLSLVREALERSVAITARLLPLSVPQGAEEAPLLLADLVRAALASVQPDLVKEGITVELDLQEGLIVTIDHEQLGFVAEALLVNAWHAVLDRAVRRIRVITGNTNGEVFLRVEDTGIGIAREKLSSLFTPFFSEKGEHAVPQSPQARVRGVGLSLAVAQAIVTARAGKIEIESTPGTGSAFTVRLPGG
jgi:PAS domain S-box-containing protein